MIFKSLVYKEIQHLLLWGQMPRNITRGFFFNLFYNMISLVDLYKASKISTDEGHLRLMCIP